MPAFCDITGQINLPSQKLLECDTVSWLHSDIPVYEIMLQNTCESTCLSKYIMCAEVLKFLYIGVLHKNRHEKCGH